VRHKADLASLICRTRSDQTIVLKQKSRVELGSKSEELGLKPTILTDVRSVCLSVCLCITQHKLTAARAVYAVCHVHGVIWCCLCQITLATRHCYYETGTAHKFSSVSTMQFEHLPSARYSKRDDNRQLNSKS